MLGKQTDDPEIISHTPYFTMVQGTQIQFDNYYSDLEWDGESETAIEQYN